MLHRLFSAQNHRLSEADLRSHLLLHGENSERIGTLGGHDVRLIIAQDLGEKAKVVLLDTQRPPEQREAKQDHGTVKKSSVSNSGPRRPPGFPSPKETTSSPELITELMFGTAPLSYRGTSVRLHPLPSNTSEDTRSFLFTKVFTVDFAGVGGLDTPDSNMTSLSSSYSSASGIRAEYPFPTMTPIQDERSTTTTCVKEHRIRDLGTSPSRAFRGHIAPHPRPISTSTSRTRQHQRAPSGGNRSEFGDAAPYVPFTKADHGQAQDDHFTEWLPSPGPVLIRRRLSIDTNGSASPGSQAGGSRYQAAMCGIGIIFTVPGSGQEHTECALMTRCWQMMTRATYALQRVIYDELEMTCRFMTAHGVIQTPRSRNKVPKSEAQVFQRGKKFYVALGQYSLHASHPVANAVDSFRARLMSGVNLPEIQHTPLVQEADILVDELNYMMDTLDHKEAKFMFSTLISYMVEYVTTMKSELSERDIAQHNSLQNRIVIVSDNVVLARRLIFCIARLFFREHNEHLQTAVDYALVWPSSGLLRMPKKDLMRRRRSTLAKATKLNRGWDIPGHGRPLSSSSYNLPLISPSVYHRPPSTASNTSSRGSSWKPSWSWFANSSRTALSGDDSARSESRTVHTSWTSSDFADMPKSPNTRSPRSWSPDAHADAVNQVRCGHEDSSTDDDEDGTDSVETTVPPLHIEARKNSDGVVDVAFLSTVSISAESDVSEVAQLDEARAEFPLTGVLSRFHPDMLLQAIPQAAYTDALFKEYLAEEDLYIPQRPMSGADSWSRSASITIAELGHSWRLRKLTRLVRNATSDAHLPSLESGGLDIKRTEPLAPLQEESWEDEIITEINEPLIQSITKATSEYSKLGNSACVQNMVDSLLSFSTQ